MFVILVGLTKLFQFSELIGRKCTYIFGIAVGVGSANFEWI